MKRGEKRQKLHESLIQMLYPPTTSGKDEPESIDTSGLNLDQIPDELDEDRRSTSSTDADEAEGEGPKKMSRAQRKRLRKKKLKESASSRRKNIGPLLPTSSDDGIGEGSGDVVKNEPPSVRENAAEIDDNIRTNKPESEEAQPCMKQNKLKQRRMTKKLGTAKETASNTVRKNA